MLALLAPALLAAALLFQTPGAAQSSRLSWVPNPRTTNRSWVADPARHLRRATVATLDSEIAQLERETTTEIAVVVLDSLDGLEAGDAAHLLHRRWGVGKRERDNGIVLLWSPALRKTFVSVGYGLEGVIPDARAGRVQDQVLIRARGDLRRAPARPHRRAARDTRPVRSVRLRLLSVDAAVFHRMVRRRRPADLCGLQVAPLPSPPVSQRPRP